MRKKLFYIIVMVFSISVISYILVQKLNIVQQNKQKNEFIAWLTTNAQKQSASKRNFTSVQWISTTHLDTSTVKLFYPQKILLDSTGYYYILDWATQQIKKYDSLGNHVRTFGKGKGVGPRYFNNITDYKILHDHLYINDPTQGKIEIYHSRTGEFLQSIKLDIPVSKFTPTNHSTLVGKPVIHTEYFLGVFNNQRLISPILNNFIYTQKTTLISDAHIIGQSNNIVVIFIMGGYFFRYDVLQKRVNYIAQTIIPVEFPEVEEFSYGMRIAPDRKFAALSASVSDHWLLTFSTRTAHHSIADFYSLGNGEYQFSVQLNKKYLDLKFHKNFIFALSQHKVDIYEIKKLTQQ